MQLRRWSQDETIFISGLMVSALLVCVCGFIYIGAYMNVAYQGRRIHDLQAALTAETARQHTLIYDIAFKESPGRIAIQAQKLGMVMGGKAAYVTIGPSAVRGASNANQAVMAETSPDEGTGTLGDN
jgi:hypothetical protein